MRIFFLYKLYQIIPSCTIWYCIDMYCTNGTNASISDFKWSYTYGQIQYNHKLIYTNTDQIYNNGTSADKSYYKRTETGSEYWNNHNTIFLFNNSRLLEDITKEKYIFPFYINYTKLFHHVLYGIVLQVKMLVVKMQQQYHIDGN